MLYLIVNDTQNCVKLIAGKTQKFIRNDRINNYIN